MGGVIGIFLADVLYGHHDALLSLLVGVSPNFGFFVVGRITLRSRPDSSGADRTLISTY